MFRTTDIGKQSQMSSNKLRDYKPNKSLSFITSLTKKSVKATGQGTAATVGSNLPIHHSTIRNKYVRNSDIFLRNRNCNHDIDVKLKNSSSSDDDFSYSRHKAAGTDGGESIDNCIVNPPSFYTGKKQSIADKEHCTERIQHIPQDLNRPSPNRANRYSSPKKQSSVSIADPISKRVTLNSMKRVFSSDSISVDVIPKKKSHEMSMPRKSFAVTIPKRTNKGGLPLYGNTSSSSSSSSSNSSSVKKRKSSLYQAKRSELCDKKITKKKIQRNSNQTAILAKILKGAGKDDLKRFGDNDLDNPYDSMPDKKKRDTANKSKKKRKKGSSKKSNVDAKIDSYFKSENASTDDEDEATLKKEMDSVLRMCDGLDTKKRKRKRATSKLRKLRLKKGSAGEATYPTKDRTSRLIKNAGSGSRDDGNDNIDSDEGRYKIDKYDHLNGKYDIEDEDSVSSLSSDPDNYIDGGSLTLFDTYEELIDNLNSLKSVLADIKSGKEPSDRHVQFYQGSRQDRMNLRYSVQGGELSDENFGAIASAIREWFAREEDIKEHGFDAVSYAMDVIVPEAIVRLYMLRYDMDYDDAQNRLQWSRNNHNT